MGNSLSSLNLNLPDLNQFDYFAIQMGHTDRLRLIMAPQYIIDATTQRISQTWPISDIETSPGFAQLYLKGFPWSSISTADLDVKFFMCSLIQKYSELGWHLKSSSDINAGDNDMSVLFFEKGPPVIQSSVICLSLNSYDKIRVLAPDDVLSGLL